MEQNPKVLANSERNDSDFCAWHRMRPAGSLAFQRIQRPNRLKPELRTIQPEQFVSRTRNGLTSSGRKRLDKEVNVAPKQSVKAI